MAVNKITWDRVGRVTEPGRYMYTFGWLTIAAGDLAIWQQYPQAAFTLLGQHAVPNEAAGEEFHLGAFDVAPDARPSYSLRLAGPADSGRNNRRFA